VDGLRVSRKRVARLMRELEIEGVSRRGKRRVRRSAAEAPAAPDLVRRNFTATAPDELWVADITVRLLLTAVQSVQGCCRLAVAARA
jgi:transposase InsO family protein